MKSRFTIAALCRIFAPRRSRGVRCPGFSRSSAPAYSSAPEARLAVCRRMSTACLLRRVARGRWSRTSHRAAVTILDRRALGMEH